MASQSVITIDGIELRTRSISVLALYEAIMRALDRLEREERDSTWIPLLGNTDDGTRTAQVVRLRKNSAINIVAVDDGSTPDEFYDRIGELHGQFMKNGMDGAS